MKYTKTLLAAAVAVSMVAPMVATTAHAADDVNGTSAEPTTASAHVTYNVTEGYTWNIHSDINFDKDAGAKGKTVVKQNNVVSVTKNVIKEGKKLHITAKGSGEKDAFTINNGGSEVLNYTVTNGGTTIEPNGLVMDVVAGTDKDNKDLTFTLTTTNKAAEVAGEYSGTVTYTASIVDAN